MLETQELPSHKRGKASWQCLMIFGTTCEEKHREYKGMSEER